MKENILIIGGGAAGMEAATQLRNLGLTPIIVEKSSALGGHVAQWDRLFPTFHPAKDVLDKMLDNLKGVKTYLNTEVTDIQRSGEDFKAMLSDGNTIEAKAVILATGFEVFKAERKQEYGYGIYNNVITSVELEQFFRKGKDERINNPKRIGFVHCVGARDVKVCNTYCSKVCCTTALKQACEIKEVFPDAEVYTFYMDLRMFGPGYEDLYLKTQKDFDVKCIRGRVCEVSEDIEGRLVIKAEDTLFGKPMKMTLDLLVLMCSMEKNKSIDAIQQKLGVENNSDGFMQNKDMYLGMNDTKQEGVFVAGACTAPKSLPDTVGEARSVAMEVFNYINKK
ncbi:MAG: FAD-dependent oxidoreductase [Bacteroidales bacterium]|nr:FAD-dependent oxidoreductase [Bacteroidales bacterium]